MWNKLLEGRGKKSLSKLVENRRPRPPKKKMFADVFELEEIWNVNRYGISFQSQRP